jgi:nucleoside-diphosphate-sugar epimerase
MRVFATGASGFIGSAVVVELLDAGHEVVGLARSDDAAAALTAAGIEVHRGPIDDLDSLHDAATDADGVIHLAFDNSFSDYAAANAADVRAVEAMGAALDESDKPFVVTSGTLALAFTPGLGIEDDESDPALPSVASEHATIALACLRSRLRHLSREAPPRPGTRPWRSLSGGPPCRRRSIRAAALSPDHGEVISSRSAGVEMNNR